MKVTLFKKVSERNLLALAGSLFLRRVPRRTDRLCISRHERSAERLGARVTLSLLLACAEGARRRKKAHDTRDSVTRYIRCKACTEGACHERFGDKRRRRREAPRDKAHNNRCKHFSRRISCDVKRATPSKQ